MHPLCNQNTINEMQRISNQFYADACRLGFHNYIEFCGLHNEFIKMCQETMDSGEDFVETNIHSENKGLTAYSYNGDYLAEKLSCVFGSTFENNKNFKNAFMKKLGFTKK